MVSATRPGAYRTIQEAIDAAPENASIVIEPGCYSESLRITKAVEVSAQGGVDETIIEKIEGDEESMAVIDCGPVSLRGLTFRTGVNCTAIEVLDGTVVIDDCTIERECAVPSDKERAGGVLARWDGVDLTVQNCRIKGFRWGVYAADEARVVVDGCHIRSDWTRERRARGRARAPSQVCGLSREQASKSGGRPSESYNDGAVVVNGGQAHLSGIRIAYCYTGIKASGEGASAVVEDCEIDDVDYGIRAFDGSRITVRACDISYIGTGIRARGGVIEVEQCKRISGGATAWGVWASEGGTAELRGCRIFGGEVGLWGDEDGTIRAIKCGIFRRFQVGWIRQSRVGPAAPGLRHPSLR